MGKQDCRLLPSLASTPMIMGVGLQQDIANPPYTFGFPMLSLHKLNFVAFYPVAETISGANFYLHLFPGLHVPLTRHFGGPPLIPQIAATFFLNLSLHQQSSPESWQQKHPHNFRGCIPWTHLGMKDEDLQGNFSPQRDIANPPLLSTFPRLLYS